jgi:MFS family permease
VGAALLLAVWVVPMGLSGTAVALTPISVDLGADQTLLQWVVNGFNVVFAVFTLVWGMLSDRIGYRTTFRFGVVLYLAGATLTSLAGSLAVVVVTRTLAGVAGAAVFTGAASVISNTFDGRARGRMFALYGATIGLGLASGPSIAGALIAVSGWRLVYAVHAVLLVLALTGSLLIPRVMSPTVHPTRRIDISFLRNPRFMAMCLVAVAGSIGFVTMLTYLPTAFSATLGLTDASIGLHMLPLTIPVFCGPFLGEWLARKGKGKGITATTVIVLGLILLCTGLAGMLLLSPDHSAMMVLLPTILIGTGFGLSLGLVDAEALSTVPSQSSGTAAGILNFFRMGSEAVFVGLYGGIVAFGVNARLANRTEADTVISGQFSHPGVYRDAFSVAVYILLGLLVATAATAALLLWRRHAHRAHDTEVTSVQASPIPTRPAPAPRSLPAGSPAESASSPSAPQMPPSPSSP